MKLSSEKAKISVEVEEMIERAVQDYKTALLGLQGAAAFGSTEILAKILDKIDVALIGRG